MGVEEDNLAGLRTYPRTLGRFPTLMNRPTSHPEQRLLLVRVSDNNYDENTKLIVTSFQRKNIEDANNNNTTTTSNPSSSDDVASSTSSSSFSSEIDATTQIVNINLDDILKFFNDAHSQTNCYLFTKGAEPIRHFLIPLFAKNDQFIPHQLLQYYDVSMIYSQCQDENDVQVAQIIIDLNQEELEKMRQNVNSEYKSAPIIEEDCVNREDGDCLIVRARGLPWQASDQHVAQFFAGLDIVPGGIALCLSSEGRRNGEVLVQFASSESRELALKRHRDFLLSRYIEVYKATMDDFLHVASGSSTEAMEFVSTNAIIVRMRGLPYDCTDVQIKQFFEPLKVLDKIMFISRSDGRPTGDAFVQFATDEEVQLALQKHRQTIGQRYIELFKSTAAEVQQVVKRCNQINNSMMSNNNNNNNNNGSMTDQQIDEKRKDCLRLRGLPYEAQVQHIVNFLGDFAKMVKFQGVHMVFNNQGHPSGEAFIQMINEQSASSSAVSLHNKFMVIGKKQRYIEVFQCSPEDLNLQHLVKQTAAAIGNQQLQFMAPVPVAVPVPVPTSAQQQQLQQQQQQQQQQQFWTSYPSPPISPIIPGQVTQLVVYGITTNIGINELIAQFSTPEIQVEHVIFTRWPTPLCPGEAVVTVRSRQVIAPPPALSQLSYQYGQHHQQQQQFIPQPLMMEQ